MKRFFVVAMMVLCGTFVSVAQNVSGRVVDAEGNALVGATVFWNDTTVGTVTDAEGRYEVYRVKGHNVLVATYLGYTDAAVEVSADRKVVDFTLTNGVGIEEIVVEGSMGGNFIRQGGIAKDEMISFAGLCKMACCNLAESFENSASVTVG